jgi:hypothetical protein
LLNSRGCKRRDYGFQTRQPLMHAGSSHPRLHCSYVEHTDKPTNNHLALIRVDLPLADTHEADLPGQVSELVLSFTAVDHDGVTGSGGRVAQPGVAGELPDGLDRVHLHRAKRQRHESDPGRAAELV